MATATVIWLKEVLGPVIKHQHITPVRNMLLGAGFAYAVEQKKYWHLPAVVLVPSVYVGYQAFKVRDAIRSFITHPKSSTTGPATEV